MVRFLGPLALAGREKLAARSGFFLSNPSGYDVLRIAAAVVLLVAAALKTQQLATEPTLGSSIFESRWFLMLTVEFELFFGLWLLANIMPRATWAAALGCFGLFACVSLYKAISGHASCGCFGRVPVNPWYTTTLDLAIVLSLLRWRPRQLPSPACGKEAGGEGRLLWSVLSIPKEVVYRAMVVILSWLIIGLPAGYAMGSYTDTTLSDAGRIIGNGKIVVLDPGSWVGRRFPLLNYIDRNDMIENGKWLVLLYHYDCPKCKETIKNISHEMLPKDADARVALIEVPPCSESKKQDALLEAGVVFGRLDEALDWIVSTPTKAWLDSGKVVAVSVDNGNKK